MHIKKWKYAQTNSLKKIIKDIIDNDPSRPKVPAMIMMPKHDLLIPEITNEGVLFKMFNPETNQMEVIADFTVGHQISAARLKVGNLE